MKTSDGLTLHTRVWSPSCPTGGTVVLVHGLGEHIERYQALAEWLNAEGWRVHGFDHRGHGRSEGRRGDIAEPHSLLSDLGAVVQAVYRTSPAHPVVLLGHSMGGLVAARFVAEGAMARPAPWYTPVDALALSSPAIDPGLSWLQRRLVDLGVSMAPHASVGNGLKAEWICRDPRVVAAYRRDALVHDRISPLLAKFLATEGQQVLTLAPRWTIPTLLMWSGIDRCVRAEGSLRLAGTLPARLTDAGAYFSLGHEIFNDLGHRVVWARLRDWLQGLGSVHT